MKNIAYSSGILAALVLLLYCTMKASGQEQTIIFIKDYSSDKEISQNKAKYSKTTVIQADITTVEVHELSSGKLISRISNRENEPVGIWLLYNGESTKELDYDFEVEYSNISEINDESLKHIPDLSINCDSLNYLAPIFGIGDFATNILSHLQKHILYPDFAKDMGIQGTVYAYFEISEDGLVENVKIRRGVHIALDKESCRVIKSLKFDAPAKLNGVSIRLKHTFPVKFSLR